MQKKYNRLKIKIIKKEKRKTNKHTDEERKKGKRKTPQNCKGPMQWQRFVTTIKSVTEYTRDVHFLKPSPIQLFVCVYQFVFILSSHVGHRLLLYLLLLLLLYIQGIINKGTVNISVHIFFPNQGFYFLQINTQK